MGNARDILVSRWLWPLAAALAYYGFAILMLGISQGVDGIATIWPSSGVLVAALLLSDRRGQVATLVATAIASFAANYQTQPDVLTSLGYTQANLVEAAVATCLIRSIPQFEDMLDSPSGLLKFLFAVFFSSLTGATIAFLITPGATAAAFMSWFTTVSLGQLVVVPLILRFAARIRSDQGLFSEFGTRSLLMLGIVLVTSALVFTQTAYPLLFLPTLAILAATYSCGQKGATGGVLIVAIIGTLCTGAGNGPIHLINVHASHTAVSFFQFYLFINFIASLPLAALQHQRRQALAKVLLAKRWMEMGEALSAVGHWRLDLRTDTLFWSDQIYRIHGMDPGTPITLEKAVNAYHEDDRERVARHLEDAIATYSGFEFEARIVRTDGEIRYVSSRGDLEYGEGGAPIAIFGIFQDVTERALQMLALSQAREDAENAANAATRISLTDPLTGIANRRRIMAELDSALQQNGETGTPVTVALLDIDNFKTINDTFGHAVGDRVIREVAKLSVGAVRSTDSVGRIGGEEFLLVFPGATGEATSAVAERLRLALAGADWSACGIVHQVTASLGIAQWQGESDANALLQRADTALYEAKRSGRNRLSLAA